MTILNKKYIAEIDNYRVEVKKIHRTRTQYEYYLNIFHKGTDIESTHLFAETHLTKRGAFAEARRAITARPKVVKTYYVNNKPVRSETVCY